jgi:hypothetical protein
VRAAKPFIRRPRRAKGCESTSSCPGLDPARFSSRGKATAVPLCPRMRPGHDLSPSGVNGTVKVRLQTEGG